MGSRTTLAAGLIFLGLVTSAPTGTATANDASAWSQAISLTAKTTMAIPMDAYPDPAHSNPWCSCFDPQTLDLLFTSTRPHTLQEVSTLISGAERAAKDHNVSISIYQDTSYDGTGLANTLLDIARSDFQGTIITDLPSLNLPSFGSLQVVMNNYPNMSVAPVMAGEENIGTIKNLLPYIGPNNTYTGQQALASVLRAKNNLVLCINPFQGISSKFDAICNGAVAAMPSGGGSVEIFSTLSATRIDSAQASILERLNTAPYPTAIISPESTITDILLGTGSDSLVSALQSGNIPVVAVGISASAVAGMKRGLVTAVLDNGEFMQGYLSVVQAYLFRQQNARLANTVVLTGPTVYARAALAAAGRLDAFYAHAADHIAGFPPSAAATGAMAATAGTGSYQFTVATHASASSSFWAGLRSGVYWGSRNTNSSVTEMVTIATDATLQAGFIKNVTMNADPVATDGWIVTLSRWAAFLPYLLEADKRNVPMVVVNTPGNATNTTVSFPRVLGYVAADDTSMIELAKYLLGKNPGATQALCIDSNTPLPENGDCGVFKTFVLSKGLNFTYINAPDNSVSAGLLFDSVLAGFQPSAKFIVADRTGNCVIVDNFRKAKFKLGLNSQVLVGSFDFKPSLLQAMQNGDVVISVLQQSFLQGYIPNALLRVYFLTGGFPFGEKLVRDPNRDFPWPSILTGPFLADASLLTAGYVNCSTGTPSTTGGISNGPLDIRSFPFAQVAWPVCNLRVPVAATIPVAAIPWTSPHAAAVAAMCATMTALILAAFVVMGVNSSHAIVKAMSPVFVAVILAGMLALELMALSWIGDWTRWKCHVETFVLPGAFSLLMGALFIKNYRLYKIFNTPMVLKTGLSNIELILSTCAVVTPNLVLAIVWTVIAPKYPKLKTVNLGSGDFSSYYQCASDSPGTDKIILIVLYAYNALLVGATVWIAFVTRNIKAQLSETVYIGYSVYNAVATSVVLIPLLFAGMITDFTVLFWFRSIVLIYPVAFAFWIMFGKRILLDTWFADSTGKLKRTGNPFSMSTGSSGLRSSAESEVLIAKGESITSYVNVLHQTGAMSSWKRKYAHYKDDSGVITLFDKETSATGQSLNMSYFCAIRVTSDDQNKRYSLGFAQLKVPLPSSASITRRSSPPLGPAAVEKLTFEFDGKKTFEVWSRAFPTSLGGLSS